MSELSNKILKINIVKNTEELRLAREVVVIWQIKIDFKAGITKMGCY